MASKHYLHKHLVPSLICSQSLMFLDVYMYNIYVKIVLIINLLL